MSGTEISNSLHSICNYWKAEMHWTGVALIAVWSLSCSSTFKLYLVCNQAVPTWTINPNASVIEADGMKMYFRIVEWCYIRSDVLAPGRTRARLLGCVCLRGSRCWESSPASFLLPNTPCPEILRRSRKTQHGNSQKRPDAGRDWGKWSWLKVIICCVFGKRRIARAGPGGLGAPAGLALVGSAQHPSSLGCQGGWRAQRLSGRGDSLYHTCIWGREEFA